MKAIVWTKYGSPDGLILKEVEKPAPKDDEVLVRIHATTVTAGDCEMRSLKFPLMLRLPLRLYVGLRRPSRITVLGQELAGEVAAVGKDVHSFQAGDQVHAHRAAHRRTDVARLQLKCDPRKKGRHRFLVGDPAKLPALSRAGSLRMLPCRFGKRQLAVHDPLPQLVGLSFKLRVLRPTRGRSPQDLGYS